MNTSKVRYDWMQDLQTTQTNPSSSARDLLQRAHELGKDYHKPGMIRLAVAICRKACAMAPDDPECADGLARMLHLDGQTEEAIAVYDRFLVGHPDASELRLARLLRTLPSVLESRAHLLRVRGRYELLLQELETWIDKASPEACRRLLFRSRSVYPSLLPYQGLNDAPLQQRLGRLLHDAMRRFDYADPQVEYPLEPGDRPRIGFVSNQIYQHTIWQTITWPWLSGLARRGFACFVYAPDNKREDGCTALTSAHCVSFHIGEQSFEDWVRRIRDDRLHALIYPSLGYSKTVDMLALLRLAPVQCLTVGHCETSGFPTLDYFISSDLMEPPEGDDHYTESLVRLPNIGFSYATPPDAPLTLSREDFGFDEKDLLYLSPHLPHKYLPWHDVLYVGIAAAQANARLTFFRDPRDQQASKTLEHRLRRAFAQHDPDLSERIVFLDRLPRQRYQCLLALADIYLDVSGWNGGTTTAEALGFSLPVVTLEGDLARGRMGAAMLRHLGVNELIATYPEDYVRLAVRLGLDRVWRLRMRARIEAKRHLITDDSARIEGLADFLLDAIPRTNSPE